MSKTIRFSPERVKEEAKKKNVSINALAEISENGKDKLSKYRALRKSLDPNTNKLLTINEEVLDKIARRLNVARDYLSGMSTVEFYEKEKKYGFLLVCGNGKAISSQDHIPTYKEQIYLDYAISLNEATEKLLNLYGSEYWHWNNKDSEMNFPDHTDLHIVEIVRQSIMKSLIEEGLLFSDDYSKYLNPLAAKQIEYTIEFYSAQFGEIDGYDSEGNRKVYSLATEEEKQTALNEWIMQSVTMNKEKSSNDLRKFDSGSDFDNEWKRLTQGNQDNGKHQEGNK